MPALLLTSGKGDVVFVLFSVKAEWDLEELWIDLLVDESREPRSLSP